jgi:hypothetical protein
MLNLGDYDNMTYALNFRTLSIRYATLVLTFLVASQVAAVAPLTITSGVSGNAGRTGEQYAWIDANGQPRVAVLARNNVSGGGMLDRYMYQLASAATRTVNATADYAGGFGYVVSHLPYENSCPLIPPSQFCYSNATIGDDSPLGLGFTGTYSIKFAGRHHAIHEFKTTYPRFTGPHPTGAPFIRYDVPVTIQWMFVNGRDHPLWSVTWDWSAVPASLPLAQQIEGDSRGPYGDLQFDGISGSGNVIGGVAWAVDQRRFITTTAPFTLSSDWTWNTVGAAAIPYNMLWINNANAQMGVVQTSLLSTHDAGNGGYGASIQGQTSSTVTPCPDENHKMPCTWNWPYQSIENDFYNNVGALDPNANTTGRRLAWGAKLGAIGRDSYTNYAGGTTTQSKYKSYSTFIVLGEHNPGASVNPTMAQVREQESILKSSASVTMSASVGTLSASGPAGVARNDIQTYSRAGYSPVYATWEVNASANAATINWVTQGADTIKNPVLRVRNYTASAAPTNITFNGVTLVPDADVLMSIDATNNTLWLTLLRTVSGANNTLAISAPVPSPVCRLDIDGDTFIYATTDGLILMRVMLGMTGAAVESAAAPGSPRNTWTAIRAYLNNNCAMGLP